MMVAMLRLAQRAREEEVLTRVLGSACVVCARKCKKVQESARNVLSYQVTPTGQNQDIPPQY